MASRKSVTTRPDLEGTVNASTFTSITRETSRSHRVVPEMFRARCALVFGAFRLIDEIWECRHPTSVFHSEDATFQANVSFAFSISTLYAWGQGKSGVACKVSWMCCHSTVWRPSLSFPTVTPVKSEDLVTIGRTQSGL